MAKRKTRTRKNPSRGNSNDYSPTRGNSNDGSPTRTSTRATTTGNKTSTKTSTDTASHNRTTNNYYGRNRKNPITLPSVEFAIWGYAHGKTMYWNGRTFSPFKKTVEKFASKVAAERKLYWLDDNRDKAPGVTTMGVMPL